MSSAETDSKQPLLLLLALHLPAVARQCLARVWQGCPCPRLLLLLPLLLLGNVPLELVEGVQGYRSCPCSRQLDAGTVWLTKRAGRRTPGPAHRRSAGKSPCHVPRLDASMPGATFTRLARSLPIAASLPCCLQVPAHK
jgi:hypothetical protein